MLLIEEQVQQLIEDLRGTGDTLSDKLPEGCTEDDLTEDQINEIDLEIFQCEDCSWWFEIDEEADTGKDDERVCINCYEARSDI